MPRKSSKQPPQAPVRPELLVTRDDATRQITERITTGEQLLARDVNSVDGLKAFKADHRRWSDVNAEILRRIFTTDDEVNRYYGAVGFVLGWDLTPAEELQEEREDIDRHLERLRSLMERIPFIDLAASVRQARPAGSPVVGQVTDGRVVFVVHGHDEAARDVVARFLTALDFEPLILNEQPNKTRTLIEKFEDHAADAIFAVVLLTPDDVGGAVNAPDQLRPRARQNVVLELGYFLGAWRRSRVCALYRPGVELPSDLQGLVYIELDDGGGWRLRVAQEMDAVGIDVDFNRLRSRR